MAKQDEKQRLRRRLQDYAIELATANQWLEAVEINQQILELGEDPSTYNRLGKAYLEQGRYAEAFDAYQQTLRLNPTNTIARRNLSRLESLLQHGPNQPHTNRKQRQQVDLRLFITEAGKTMLTILIDIPRSAAVEALTTGEKLELQVEGRRVLVADVEGQVVGRLDPKIGQRLSELITGGNRYIVAVVQSDPRQIRVLIREIYQDPSQSIRTSFPGKLGDGMNYLTMRYDYDTDELLEDEETPDEPEVELEEFTASDEEEELGLDEIEQDMEEDDNADE